MATSAIRTVRSSLLAATVFIAVGSVVYYNSLDFEEPGKVVLWAAAGSILLLGLGTLLVHRQRRAHRDTLKQLGESQDRYRLLFENTRVQVDERQKAEKALQASEQRFRTLADNAPVGIFLTDRLGNCVLVNDRYSRIKGLDGAEALGAGWLEDVHPDDEDMVSNAWTAAFTEGLEFALDFRIVRPDREVSWVFGRASALVDETGTITSYVGMITDTSARKRAEIERDQFFNISPDMQCIIDFDGIFQRVNPTWVRTLGFPLEDTVGAQFLSYIHPEESDPVKEMVDAMQTGIDIFQFEARFRTSSGDYRWLSLNAVADVYQRRIYATARDVTESRNLSIELRAMNLELRRQNVRVEKANRMKSEFLANMSHELRTPLNGIIGFAELMSDGRAGPVSEIHEEFLGDILTSATHLLQLINDILDLSKVEAGRMNFRPEATHVTTVAGEVCDVVRELAAEKHLRLVVEIDPATDEIELDPAKLKQVLFNYVSNAIKFTGNGGQVTIRSVPIDSAGEQFRLEVEDTGIGIHETDLGKIFEQFQQLDEGSSKQYPGTGLGLALTRRLVEAQGGRVGVDSVVGKGSTFYATLPRRFAGHDTADVAAARGGDLTQSTLDLMLSDMAAWEVLEQIQSSGDNAGTPVIAVTMVDDLGSRGFKVNSSIPKPIDQARLREVLCNAGVEPYRPTSAL